MLEEVHYNYSCVIGSSSTPHDWNESINIANPFGTDFFEVMISCIYLHLLPRQHVALIFIILKIKISDDAEATINLNRFDLDGLTIKEARGLLKEKTIKALKL